MENKKYKEAFNRNVPDGYDAGTFIIQCPICNWEFQAAPSDTIVCPECGAELEFSVEVE